MVELEVYLIYVSALKWGSLAAKRPWSPMLKHIQSKEDKSLKTVIESPGKKLISEEKKRNFSLF